MGIAHRISSLAHELLNPISVSESDIREELECHVELRALENIAAGMNPEQARLDAEKRFGNFDRKVQSCRDASLGVRRWFGYVQLALTTALLITVTLLALSYFRMQSKYETEILSLKNRIAAQEVAVVRPASNRIPLIRWSIPAGEFCGTDTWDGRSPKSVNSPWCDWSALDN